MRTLNLTGNLYYDVAKSIVANLHREDSKILPICEDILLKPLTTNWHTVVTHIDTGEAFTVQSEVTRGIFVGKIVCRDAGYDQVFVAANNPYFMKLSFSGYGKPISELVYGSNVETKGQNWIYEGVFAFVKTSTTSELLMGYRGYFIKAN